MADINRSQPFDILKLSLGLVTDRCAVGLQERIHYHKNMQVASIDVSLKCNGNSEGDVKMDKHTEEYFVPPEKAEHPVYIALNKLLTFLKVCGIYIPSDNKPRSKLKMALNILYSSAWTLCLWYNVVRFLAVLSIRQELLQDVINVSNYLVVAMQFSTIMYSRHTIWPFLNSILNVAEKKTQSYQKHLSKLANGLIFASTVFLGNVIAYYTYLMLNPIYETEKRVAAPLRPGHPKTLITSIVGSFVTVVYVMFWLSAWIFFVVSTHVVNMEFQKLNSEIEKGVKKPAVGNLDIEALRLKHDSLCNSLEHLDGIYSRYLGTTLLLCVASICVEIYTVAYSSTTLEKGGTFMEIVAHVFNIMLCSVMPAVLNFKVNVIFQNYFTTAN